MKIIDSHNHIGLSGDGGHGTAEELLDIMEKNKISLSVIFPIDEKDRGETYEKPNSRILELSQKHPQFIPFVRIVPSKGEIAIQEFKRCLDLGARGLKLKTSDGFDIDESNIILDLIPQKNHFPVVVHTSHYDHSHPREWESIMKAYPHVNFIMAHAGKDDWKEAVQITKNCPNAFLDTSTLSMYRTRLIIEMAGSEKIIFASDYPYSHPEIEIRKFELLSSDSRQLQSIFAKNAERLLGL